MENCKIMTEANITALVRTVGIPGLCETHDRNVLRALSRICQRRVNEIDIIEDHDHSNENFPKLKESLAKAKELLSKFTEFQEKKLINSIQFKYVESTEKRVGFIGLEDMGQIIVKNLLRYGHKVTILNRSQSRCDTFVRLGASVVDNAFDLVVECDIIISCASESQEAKSVIFGNHGILQGLEECKKSGKEGKGYVEMTPVDFKTSTAISEAILARRGRYLEAPVCGTLKNAEDSTLIILASGDRELFFESFEFFRDIGSHAYYMSDSVGYGSKTNQLLSMVYNTVCSAVAEAMALAVKFRLPQDEFLKILRFGPLQWENIMERWDIILEPNPSTIVTSKPVQKPANLAPKLGNKKSQHIPVAAAGNKKNKRGRFMKQSEPDMSDVLRTAKVQNSTRKKRSRKGSKSTKSKAFKKRIYEKETANENPSIYKFPKLKASLDKAKELLLYTIEYQEKKFNSSSLQLKCFKPTTKKIGFIGLGYMGQTMIRNLLNFGCMVTILDRSQSTYDEFVKLGASVADNACDLVVECDIICSCVSNPRELKALMFGQRGILEGFEYCAVSGKEGKGYVEMSSIDANTSSILSQAIIAGGGKYLEAAICGTLKNVNEASLIVLSSGDKRLFVEANHVFQAMGKRAYYISCNIGYGMKMNQLLTMVYSTVCSVVSRAMPIALRFNLPQEDFFKMLRLGPLQWENIMEKCKELIVPNPSEITPLEYIKEDINMEFLMRDSES